MRRGFVVNALPTRSAAISPGQRRVADLEPGGTGPDGAILSPQSAISAGTGEERTVRPKRGGAHRAGGVGRSGGVA